LNQMPIDIVVPVGSAMARARKRNLIMIHKLFAASCMAGIALIGAAAPAYGTGQPNQSCQTSETTGGGTPGNAGSSPGSVFNEPTINSVNGGQGGFSYNRNQTNPALPHSGNAVAQYDVACVKTTNAGASTPPPATPAPGPTLHMPASSTASSGTPATTAPTATNTTASNSHKH
jgi:hypothetical protein